MALDQTEYPREVGMFNPRMIGGITYNGVSQDIQDTIAISNDEEAYKYLKYSLMATLQAFKETFGASIALTEAIFLLESARDLLKADVAEKKAIDA